MKAALVVSITLNLLLATSIVLARVDASRSGASSGSAQTAPSAAGNRAAEVRLPEPQSLSAYYDRLRAAGLDHRATILPLAGWVYRALSGAGPLHDEYWRGDAYERLRREEVAALGASLRRELEQLFAGEAATLPAFRALFRPLGPRFDFLTTEQQLAIAESRSAVEPVAPGALVRGPAVCGSSRRADSPPQMMPADLLDEEVRFELALRTSPLAVPLRSLELDETAFRSAFAALSAVVSASGPRQQLDAKRLLNEVLGERRALALLAGFDPLHAMVADALRGAGVTPVLVEEAYRALAISRDEMVNVLLTDAPGDAVAAEVAALKRLEHERLGGLVGAELAERILDEIARAGPAGNHRGTC